MAIGFSSGVLAIYDCAQAKLLRQTAVCETSITALSFTGALHDLMVASQAKLQVVHIAPTLAVRGQVETYCRSNKRAQKKAAKGQESGLAAVRLNFADDHLLQVDKKGVVRVSKVSTADSSQTSKWIQPNVHQNGVKSASFADGPKRVVTCSADEAALWSVKHDQPLVLLDEPSQDRSLQQVDF